MPIMKQRVVRADHVRVLPRLPPRLTRPARG